MSVYQKGPPGDEEEVTRVAVIADAAGATAAWAEVWTYITPNDPALPSGASITIDPVLNTEPNVADSGWIQISNGNGHRTNQSLTVSTDVGVSVFVMNATDDQGTNIENDAFPFLVTGPGEARNIGAQFFTKFFRVVIVNTSGSTANKVVAHSWGGTASPMDVVLSLDQPLFDQIPASVNRSVPVGKQPDGDYVNTPADGHLAETETPLGAAGSVTLGPYDTDGYKAIELYIATDQVSATEGISIEYTPDAQATSPVYYPGPKFTFGAEEVAEGFTVKRFPPALDGFRLTYTNGGTPQGSLFVSLELKNGATEPNSLSLENQVDSTQATLATRGAVFAKNDIGTYGNIRRGTLGGFRVSVREHEADTPIKALNNLSGNATSVGASAVQVATSPPAGTRSVEIHADPDNTKVIYLGFDSGVTSGNAPVALAAGDARVYEVDDTPEFWAITTGSQTIRWTFIADV